jgi:hypothetical protein
MSILPLTYFASDRAIDFIDEYTCFASVLVAIFSRNPTGFRPMLQAISAQGPAIFVSILISVMSQRRRSALVEFGAIMPGLPRPVMFPVELTTYKQSNR